MFSIFAGFDKHKFKTALTMAAERIKLHRNKRNNELKIERKEIGKLLAARDFDRARIKAESIIRKEKDNKGEETLELMCDLLVARISLIATEKVCPDDLMETVHTVMWASKRTQVAEMADVRGQLLLKYGDGFAAPAMKGEGKVNPRVKAALDAHLPADTEIIATLEAIAKDAGVAFNAAEDLKYSTVGLTAMAAPEIVVPPPAASIAAASASATSTTTGTTVTPAGPQPPYVPGGPVVYYSDIHAGGGMVGPGVPVGPGYPPPHVGVPAYPFGVPPFAASVPMWPGMYAGAPMGEPCAPSTGYTYPSPIMGTAVDDGHGDVPMKPSTVAPPPGTAPAPSAPQPPSYEATVASLSAAGVIPAGSHVTVMQMPVGGGTINIPQADGTTQQMVVVDAPHVGRRAGAPVEEAVEPPPATAAGLGHTQSEDPGDVVRPSASGAPSSSASLSAAALQARFEAMKMGTAPPP